jgi:transcriptional regulator with XRE-family HTH domain
METGERIRRRREDLGWTQAQLAREACRSAGVPLNSLGRQEIYRYEKGKRTPREWLPFIAQALRVSIEDLATPEGEKSPFALSGIWHSRYTYVSDSQGEVTRHHFLTVRHSGGSIKAESLPGSNDSPVSLELTIKGSVATGTWTEETAAEGYYQGAVYHGAVQMLVDLTGRRMTGKWVGFTRDFTVDSGPWEMTFKDASTSPATVRQYDRPPIL